MAAFPDKQIDLTAQAAFGADLTADPDTWTWTDLGTDTVVGAPRLLNTPITIQRGCTVGAPTSQSTTATIQCLNSDGYLTPKLPTSPWWPYVDVGTPIRLAMKDRSDLVDTFTRAAVSSGWGTATSGEVWQGTNASYSTNGTQALVTFSAVNAQRNQRINRTERDMEIVFDVSASVVPTGSALNAGPLVRSSGSGAYNLWCPVSFNTTGQVALFAIRTYASVGTTLTSVTVPSLTFSAGTMIRCRVRVAGNSIKMRAWLASGSEPSTWHIDTVQTGNIVTGWNGTLGATDIVTMRSEVSSAVTSTLPITYTFDNVTIAQYPSYRIEGYITDVRPTFNPQTGGTTWSTVLIDIGGVGSRLERQDAPALSPLRRSVEKSTPPPIEYWPCEDAEGSTVAVSAFPGHPAMTVTGPAVFAFSGSTPTELYQSRFGTKPMVSVAAGAKLSGFVPATTVVTEWAVSLVAEFYVPGILPAVTELRVAEWRTGGTFARWALIGTTTGYKVRAYNDGAATTTDVVTSSTAFQGQQTYTVEVTQNGANIDVQLRLNDNLAASGSVAGTASNVTRLDLNPDQANVTASTTPAGLTYLVGHARVVDDTAVRDLPYYTDAEQGGIVIYAGNAWFHESAHKRAQRLCDEERVRFYLISDPGSAGLTPLNAQQDGSFTTLVTAAAESESGGLLYESGFGYAMLPRSARYNAAVVLTVNMATYAYSAGTDPESVLVPQLDSRLPNVITVQRTNGAEGSYAASDEYRKRRGSIGQGYTLDVLTDNDPRQHAAWREHVNVDAQDALYPSTQIDLAANPSLIDAWLSCDIGSRIQRTSQPTIAGLGVIDQVILGITETIGPNTWLVVADTAPAKVWDVAVADDTARRYDSASTTLGATASSSASPLNLSTAFLKDKWTVEYAPFDLLTSGEQITVGWMSNVGSIVLLPGGFEDTLTGWTTVGGTQAQSTAQHHAGGASVLLTVSGSPAQTYLRPTSRPGVTVGASYRATMWVYSVAGVSNVQAAIDWFDGGGSYLSTSAGTLTTIPAATWTQLTVTGTAPASAATGAYGPTMGSSPANGTQLFVDDVDLVKVTDADSTTGPWRQYAFVTRSVNGVVKTLPAGEEVHVANPGRWAL